MTANHAHKKSLRRMQELVSAPEHRYPYQKLERMAEAEKARDIRVHSAMFDEKTLRAGSYALIAGAHLVVFGGAGSGKSSAAHGVMELLEGVPRVYFDTDRYNTHLNGPASHPFKSDDPSHRHVNCDEPFPDFSESFAAFDEIRGLSDLTSVTSHATVLLTVHAQDKASARKRIENHTGLDLPEAVYLRVDRDYQSGEFTAEIV